MRYLLTLLLLGSFSAFAEEVSRETAAAVIDEMVRTNTISAEEAKKAKVRLQSMNTDEWNKLNADANAQAARMPASVPEEAPSNEDISHEQFQTIQADLANIAPHYKQN